MGFAVRGNGEKGEVNSVRVRVCLGGLICMDGFLRVHGVFRPSISFPLDPTLGEIRSLQCGLELSYTVSGGIFQVLALLVLIFTLSLKCQHRPLAWLLDEQIKDVANTSKTTLLDIKLMAWLSALWAQISQYKFSMSLLYVASRHAKKQAKRTHQAWKSNSQGLTPLNFSQRSIACRKMKTIRL